MYRIVVLYLLLVISVLLCGVVQAESNIANDTNKTIKVVYVCAFVGKLNSEWKCTVKVIQNLYVSLSLFGLGWADLVWIGLV
jgi:hypothetical protein